MTDAHLDPARKHDFVFLFDVVDGNPNGDPDAGGMPRTDPETQHGLVTDVAIKRKIRNMVSLLGEGKPGYDIYVEAGVSLNSKHERAYAEGQASTPAQAQRWMAETFFDVRMFGAVMSTGKKSAGRLQGPVQITFSRSFDPVMPQEHGITRVTRTREEDSKETEMGGKHAVPYGLYKGIGHFSAPLGEKTGVRGEDLSMLWRAITLMFEHDRSSTRGEMSLRGLYVFTHADKFGTVPANTLTDRVTARRDDPTRPARTFADYAVTVDEEGLPEGVVLTRIVG